MISSRSRGHDIVFIRGRWVYLDNLQVVTKNRSCKKCGCLPTNEGHDACLGHIEGITSACCGHGHNADKIMEA